MSLPFFEAYFSNFIEGTEFSIDEAEAIVESGEIPQERPDDAHDVLGTFEAVHEPALGAATPATLEEFFELLDRRHRLVMGGRPDKRPDSSRTSPIRPGRTSSSRRRSSRAPSWRDTTTRRSAARPRPCLV